MRKRKLGSNARSYMCVYALKLVPGQTATAVGAACSCTARSCEAAQFSRGRGGKGSENSVLTLDNIWGVCSQTYAGANRRRVGSC